ncbi:MAG: hypothetical protein ACK5IQ_09440 [Bacteroidales bacterium]
MKRILYNITAILLLFTACEPVETRTEAGSVLSAEELSKALNIDVQGNNVICTNSNSGVITYWKSSFGSFQTGGDVKFYIPVQGDFTMEITAFSDGGTTTVSKDFSIAERDDSYFSSSLWDLLTNGAEGKTWVWATDYPGGAVWGNGGYLANDGPAWWTVNADGLDGQGASPNDEITFDLNSGINFKVVSTGTTPGSGSGSFTMDVKEENQLMNSDGSGAVWSYGQINFQGFSIPLGMNPNNNKATQYKYEILKLTADELHLAFAEDASAGAWSTAWFFRFKRKGYSY